MAKVSFKEISKEFRSLAAPSEVDAHMRTSVGNDTIIGEMHFLKPEYLVPYSKQARKIFDVEDLNHLAASISRFGIRQPLTVIKSLDTDKFEIISGERRFRAAQIVGLQRIPCIIIKDREVAEEVALIENIQRQDLHPLEEARAFRHLIDKCPNKEYKEIAREIGVSPSKMSESLKLLELPESIQENLIINKISDRNTLRILTSLSSEQDMQKILEEQTLEKKQSRARKKRKNLLTLSLSDGNVHIEFKKTLLSSSQKEEIKEQLEEYLKILL